MGRWWLMLLLVLLVSACGGATDGSVETENGSDVAVESEDGLATLSLPSGSLPEGVSVDDVQLVTLAVESSEPGVPVLVVQLLPNGLILEESANLTVAIPAALAGGFMAIHVSGDSFEFLEGDIQQDDDGISFRTSIGHFSYVGFHEILTFETSVQATLDRLSVGETQQADVTITGKPHLLPLWLMDSFDGWIAFTFSAPQPPMRMEFAWIWWGNVLESQSQSWDPVAFGPLPEDKTTGVGYWNDDLHDTDVRWEASATSECIEPNRDGPMFRGQIYFGLTVMNRGEPTWPDWYTTEPALPTEARPQHIDDHYGAASLSDISVGDSFRAGGYARGEASSVCGDAGTSTSSTSTSTTEPLVGEDPEGDQEDSESEQVAKGEGEPGGDIKSVRHELDASGNHCFIIEVYGDGETLAVAGSGWYDIIIGAVDSDDGEWKANVAYFEPTPTDRGVRVGPPEPGQPTVEGAVVSAAWEDSDTLRVCVDSGDTGLTVATFNVSIGVSTSNGTFWDYATGIGKV